jgi:hypothetical protein
LSSVLALELAGSLLIVQYLCSERKVASRQVPKSCHCYRINVRSSDGKLLVLTNPIYVNFTN